MKKLYWIFLFLLPPLFASLGGEPHFPAYSGEKNLVGILEIGKEGINQATWIYVKSALDAFKEAKPNFVILRLNTPGGEVFAAQQISDALKELDIQHGIPVVAFIDNWAISAGAMLAYSCRYIATVKDGAMGAAEPVIQNGQEMQTASEKINSALRADFANRAGYFDRSPLIAEAMVNKDMILVWRQGKVVQLSDDNEIQRESDRVITTKGKLLTLTAKEMVEYGVANYFVPPAPLPEQGSLLFTISPFKEIPHVELLSHELNWRAKFFAILANPLVASLLFLGMMLGFYIEFNTPGFGLPGIVGLVCLFLIVLSSFS
ncbi:MAG: serine protease, partial [Verrucomicrobia bacterium]|nr:serine protease [Verrucomicrobiota bacterium]